MTEIQILKILKTNERSTSDLRMINLPKSTGTLTINKVLKPNMILFEESVTGYYKNVIFEVPDEF